MKDDLSFPLLSAAILAGVILAVASAFASSRSRAGYLRAISYADQPVAAINVAR